MKFKPIIIFSLLLVFSSLGFSQAYLKWLGGSLNSPVLVAGLTSMVRDMTLDENPSAVDSSRKPNLIIEKFVYDPLNFVNGTIVNFTYSVKNNGNAVAPASYARFMINDKDIQTAYIKSLKPGGLFMVSLKWTVDVCPANIKIIADCKSQVIESLETDNTRIETIYCAGMIKSPILPGDLLKKKRLPNLTITDVMYDPGTFFENDKVRFTFKVTNIGSADAEPYPGVVITIDGRPVMRKDPGGPGSSLAAGRSSETIEYIWIAKCRSRVKIEVDSDNVITESNELDNTWEHFFAELECSE